MPPQPLAARPGRARGEQSAPAGHRDAALSPAAAPGAGSALARRPRPGWPGLPSPSDPASIHGILADRVRVRSVAQPPGRGAGMTGGRMGIDPYIVLGSAVVGLLVGLTGAGGGALMTPMLILLFGVTPSAAISSDLVAAVLMRPVGAAVHLRKGTVNLRLVGWMVLGSVPMAFAGAYLLHLLGSGSRRSSRGGDRARRRAAGRRRRHGPALRPGPARPGTRGGGHVTRSPAGRCHRVHRRGRRPHRRDDLGRLGLADDRAAAVPLPDCSAPASWSAPT